MVRLGCIGRLPPRCGPSPGPSDSESANRILSTTESESDSEWRTGSLSRLRLGGLESHKFPALPLAVRIGRQRIVDRPTTCCRCQCRRPGVTESPAVVAGLVTRRGSSESESGPGSPCRARRARSFKLADSEPASEQPPGPVGRPAICDPGLRELRVGRINLSPSQSSSESVTVPFTELPVAFRVLRVPGGSDRQSGPPPAPRAAASSSCGSGPLARLARQQPAAAAAAAS